MAAYDRAGLVLEELIVRLSGEAFRFAAALPERAAALRAGLAGRCEPEDLLVKANFVRLRKPLKASDRPAGRMPCEKDMGMPGAGSC